MAKHETRELIPASPKNISTIAEQIKKTFINEDFTVDVKYLAAGECDIVMTEKKFLADPYRLHITMKPHGDSYIDFYARNDHNIANWVVLILFLIIPVTLPLFIVFVIKMVRWSRQNDLDDRALSVAKQAINLYAK